MFRYSLFLILFGYWSIVTAAYQPPSLQTILLALNKTTDIELSRAQAKGEQLLLIMSSEYGLQTADTQLAKILPSHNIEVWLGNLPNAYFLANSASNLESIPAQDVQNLIQTIHNRTKKNIIILTTGRGAIPILRALANWPQKKLPGYLSGLILMHPKLFKKTPEPGLKAELMPSAVNTNQLIFMIQPTLSPFWWNREILLNSLQQSGSNVFLQPLANVRNRFYFRRDATLKEQKLAQNYPNIIHNAIRYINKYPKVARSSSSSTQSKPLITSIKKQRALSPYKGTPQPPSLNLKTLNGISYNLKNDLGKVVLVNFWASWCPPCVHEMPSMQRLENYFIKKQNNAFKILAVNMAEDKKTIHTFLKEKVSVDFEILLDTNGQALKEWKIFAFPTSFIIDKKGQIRYAIYGSIDWFTGDIKEKVQKLINE